MKSFEKENSPSKSNSDRDPQSSGLVEKNENDSSVDKLISKFENHKITYGKQFMSKAQRKKILAEINEDPSASNAQGHKNSNFDTDKSWMKKGASDSSVKVYDPVTNYLSPRPQYLRFNPNRRREILKRFEELNSSLDSDEASDEEEWSAEEIADSSLSPLKGSAVNQRNEGIFEEDNCNGFDVYEVETESGDEIDVFDGSSLSPPKGSAIDQRYGGISEEDNDDVVDGDEGEEEGEEGEAEERGWFLRGMLKLLLTLIACLLSTSYIFSMSSPSPSQTEPAIWNSKDSGLLINNGTLEFVSMQLQDHGLFDMEYGGNNSIEEVKVDKENYDGNDGSVEAEIVEYEDVKSEETVDEVAEYVPMQLQDHGFYEVEDGGDNSIEELEVYKQKFEEFDDSIVAEITEYMELEEKEEVGVDKENYDESDGSVEVETVEYLDWKEKEMVGNENEVDVMLVDEAAGFEGAGAAQLELRKEGFEPSSDAETDENENEYSEDIVDKAAEFEGVRAAQIGEDEDNVNEGESAEFEHLIDAETDEKLDGGIVLDMEVVSTHVSLDEDEDEDNVNEGESAETEIIGGGVVDCEELVGSPAELSDSKYEVEKEKSEWNTSTVIGLFAVFMISASLALIHHSKNSRRNTSSTESEPSQEQQLVVEENVKSVIPSSDRKVEFLARAPLSSHSMRELTGHINMPTVEENVNSVLPSVDRKVQFLARAPLSSHSMTELTSHIKAPTVELIGEIVIGQPSSLRNSRKFQSTISEEECNTLSQKRGSLPKLATAPSQPLVIEPHPPTSSPSCGSFTTQRKISKKEGGQSRESMNVPTPVRRSSRIRNRAAVVSP